MDEAEHDVLAYMSFPGAAALDQSAGAAHCEIKRRTTVVGIFPNEDAITRLICAILVEQNNQWAVQRARAVLRNAESFRIL